MKQVMKMGKLEITNISDVADPHGGPVVIPSKKNKKKFVTEFIIRNPTAKRMAFKIRAPAKAYQVHPDRGVLGPEATLHIHVKVKQEVTEDMQERIKIKYSYFDENEPHSDLDKISELEHHDHEHDLEKLNRNSHLLTHFFSLFIIIPMAVIVYYVFLYMDMPLSMMKKKQHEQNSF